MKAILTVSIYFLTIVPSYAYLDPGTGGALIQIIVAAIAGVSVTIAFYWAKFKKFFKKIFYSKKK